MRRTLRKTSGGARSPAPLLPLPEVRRLRLPAGLLLPLLAALVTAASPLRASEGGEGDAPALPLPPVHVTASPLPSPPAHGAGAPASVLTAAELRDRGIRAPRDAGGAAPNLSVFDANGDRIPRFSARGLRENNFSAGEPSVVLYVDDVPYTDLYGRGGPWTGAERVEFLAGPRAIALGGAGPGGAVVVSTPVPGTRREGGAAASYGSYDAVAVDASASGPLAADRLFLYASASYAARDGFLHNAYLGTHPDTREAVAGRATLRFVPSGAWDVRLLLSGERFDDGAVAAVPIDQEDPYRFDRDFDGFSEAWGTTMALRVAWEGPSVSVLSVTARRDFRQDLEQDFDFSTDDLVRGFTHPEVVRWTQEIRVASREGAPGAAWSAGLFLSDQETRADSGSVYTGIVLPGPPFFLPGPFTDRTTATLTNRSAALFGEATAALSDRWALTGGLRFDADERRMARRHANEAAAATGAPPVPDQLLSDRFHGFSPRLAFAFRPEAETTAWLSLAGGYQSGGYHVSSDDPALSRYAPCRSAHAELGIRGEGKEGRLSGSALLFAGRYRDYQVYRPVTATQFAMLNAERSTALGVEVEGTARPSGGVEVRGAFGWTRAHFDAFVDAASGEDFGGRTIPFVPEFTGSLGAAVRHGSGLFARLDGRWTGRFWFDEGNGRSQAPCALADARVGWESARFAVSAFGRNLGGRRYFANVLNLRNPLDGSDFFVGTPGDPRTFGVGASARF